MPEDTQNNKAENQLKYPSPKVLLIDLDEEVSQHLKQKGFNISEGSFGKPYKVAARSKSNIAKYHLFTNGRMPDHYAESQIVIINLEMPELLPEPLGDERVTPDGDPVLVNAPFGYVDPRPDFMWLINEDFQRIYNHNGIFIIFAGPKISTEPLNLDIDGYYPHWINTWCFLPMLSTESLNINARQGQEIIPSVEEASDYGYLLQKYVRTYDFTIELSSYLKAKWNTIASNKYNDFIAGAIVPDKPTDGWIFIFPNLPNKEMFLDEFLSIYLPNLSPNLFPYDENTTWAQQEEYEIPEVLSLKQQSERITEEAAKQINEINDQIEKIRSENQYLNDIVSETSNALELAIKKGLEVLGFREVVHLDSESDNGKREDLQIRDRSPLLLIEIKGLTGTVKEHQAMQVQKYIAPRMQAEGHLDVRGLAIINHYRGLPPLEREPQPFTDVVQTNAKDFSFGLMTSFTLYKLIRNFLRLNWTHENIADLFYQNGFIESIPMHYEYLGLIEGIY
ncbi:MAG: hypothetical protein RLP44_14895 [Aggregatilineales bacterium]